MKRHFLITLGIWVWGTATAVLGIIVIRVILTGEPPELYLRVKDAATALGAVVAASALAWSHFFQTGSRSEETRKIEELSRRISELSEKISSQSGKSTPGGGI